MTGNGNLRQVPDPESITRDRSDVLLRVENLRVWFAARGRRRAPGTVIKAVDDVTFEVRRGTTVAIVGESGSGKTTVARAITGVHVPDEGSIYLDGVDLTAMTSREQRTARQKVQMVFQDPHASLNPRRRVGSVLVEVLIASGLGRSEARKRMLELLDLVHLDSRFASALPHEMSGGQRQRVGIARALATNPELVVCDEPLSALDVSIQAQVLKLLAELQDRLGITYLFISHDLAVVGALSEDVVVMYSGRIVEAGPVTAVFHQPLHPYTATLLAAVPDLESPAISPIAVSGGESQSAASAAEPTAPAADEDGSDDGCPYRPRCWLFESLGQPQVCRDAVPQRQGLEHAAACHFSDETTRQWQRIAVKRQTMPNH